MASATLLSDRGVVEVAGPDAAKFLHGILTNDVNSLAAGEARFAALLTPQGKIITDFMIFAKAAEDGLVFLLDCPAALKETLLDRLKFYKLRAAVTLTDRSGEFASVAFPEAAEKPEIDAIALAADPRAPTLGWRGLVAKALAVTVATAPRALYDAKRIAAAAPDGGIDFDYGDAFPHEANMDRLAGVDFKKGCFLGQEVVSRMKHRGPVRKRVTTFHAQGPAPAPGTPVKAGEVEIGVTGSAVGGEGLALIRLDRLADAKSGGAVPLAGGIALDFSVPEA
ncbi:MULTISPECIES: CAF17-like 4Fe-4S cluster assembly/insertion protein YgfZ [Methylosinus]|uniref:Folate-binding protein n=1 Tax=Methylosinus trichosporium (strain ATCC 35070 / NCIMB 11131 / UNIQEM 75 / OB3b) TaxID=595536 RepID=A0A2D2D4R4_METT3|nr:MULTISPECIES: folate-binding protein YgfZ [Methylosinus]ATQ69998.1 folate-binding protein [Methylosinus trichosporium OB3b]OBS50367.1 folate-binding protein [Methylosinus sp. 3S-1]